MWFTWQLSQLTLTLWATYRLTITEGFTYLLGQGTQQPGLGGTHCTCLEPPGRRPWSGISGCIRGFLSELGYESGDNPSNLKF